ncbi:MAG: IMP cyclohydrolase [Methanobacteriaceae archaeon]|nr:IMP cyclohydrolase [Methanobacteriaceae archaeon]
MVYLGRIVAIGSNENGVYGAYRVSSRSFPNRQAVITNDKVAIVPTKGSEDDIYKNPYISYNAIDIVNNTAIITNGSHTDIISGKIREGMNMRDAICLTLLTMDYEKDDYNTPRIGGAINLDGEGYIGIVTHKGLRVDKINKNETFYISTYEHTTPNKVEFNASNANDACEIIYGKDAFKEFTNPVTSCAIYGTDKWDLETKI